MLLFFTTDSATYETDCRLLADPVAASLHSCPLTFRIYRSLLVYTNTGTGLD
jgi:hypothetical protein